MLKVKFEENKTLAKISWVLAIMFSVTALAHIIMRTKINGSDLVDVSLTVKEVFYVVSGILSYCLLASVFCSFLFGKVITKQKAKNG